MIASMRAPIYIPWIPFLWQLDISDMYVVLDDTQFNRRYTNSTRNCVKFNDRKVLLSVPIQHTGETGVRNKFKDVLIDNRHNWAHKHFETLRHAYSSTDFFSQYSGRLKEIYNTYSVGEHRLMDLDIELMKFMVELFGIDVDIVYQTELDRDPTLMGEDMIIDIGDRNGITTYVCGAHLPDDVNRFSMNGRNFITRLDLYDLPRYTQVGEEHISYLSGLDLIFNVGSKGAREYMDKLKCKFG